MPHKTVQITLREPAEKVLADATKLAQKHQVEYSGDETRGQFSARGFDGSYQLTGQELTITLHTMPQGVPWFIVEAAIKNYLT